MAGAENNILYGGGVKILPSSSRDIFDMQGSSTTDISTINYTGDPEGVVSANPASLTFDPVNGDVYRKASGTGNTGWQLMNAAGGAGFGFSAYPLANIVNVAGASVFANLVFDSTTRNDGGAYDTTTGLFTAPTTDLYYFNSILQLGSAGGFTAGSQIVTYQNDSLFGLTVMNAVGVGAATQAGTAFTTNNSFIKQMVAGETLGITLYCDTAVQDVSVGGGVVSTGGSISFFSGFRVRG